MNSLSRDQLQTLISLTPSGDLPQLCSSNKLLNQLCPDFLTQKSQQYQTAYLLPQWSWSDYKELYDQGYLG